MSSPLTASRLFSAGRNCLRMPKKKAAAAGSKEKAAVEERTCPVSLDAKSGRVAIQVQAKPGAKRTAIVGINEEGVGVQISAPPSEGEANAELVRYLSSVLGVRKNDVTLHKGAKSRQKTLLVEGMSAEAVLEKLTVNVET